MINTHARTHTQETGYDKEEVQYTNKNVAS
jgi:hypothetical protein